MDYELRKDLMQDIFRKVANAVADLTGTVWVLAGALTVIMIWGLTGPVFGFSDTWQLIINTGTTIITFLMVFMIQNTQNRDNAALHAKLDELIVHTLGAHNELTAAENFSEEELRQLRKHFEEVANEGGTNAKVDRLPKSINGNSHGTRRRAPRKPRSRTSAKAKS
ncbi:MAG: low affinity iron permease family protein [Dehalococcoidia bacterium]